MNVVLEGGCRVSTMTDGVPRTHGTLNVWHQIGQATGAIAISLQVIECAPGLSPAFRNSESDNVLYYLGDFGGDGDRTTCTIFIDGRSFDLEADSGVYLRPGQAITFDNPGSRPVYFVSCQCPENPEADTWEAGPTNLTGDSELSRIPIVRLSERRAQTTADRWYRVLVDDELGSEQVTQFAGSIPPGRAPDHFHEYEEVLFILRGTGRMWAGKSSTEIGPGTCVYLPKRQVHCVENLGPGELRLLGVFYPAGSPSVRYEA